MALQDFQFIETLGQKQFSATYKVKRIKDGRIYALKKIQTLNLTIKQKQEILNEIRFLASIRHPNIISFKQAFFEIETDIICIVMEYADGGDLLKKIFQSKKGSGYFLEEKVWDIFIQIVNGLNALHELNIIHRDLRSANIYLNSNGLIKIGDFSSSIVIKHGMTIQSREGTPYYSSPELWKGQSYNKKSDMWSLGCILYEIIHFKPAFRGRDMKALYQKITQGYYGKISQTYSKQLSQVLGMLLRVKAQQRISSKKLLSHPFIKKNIPKERHFEIFQNSCLLKTIRVSSNMSQIKKKLPKPNYYPVRYRSSKKQSYSFIHQSPKNEKIFSLFEQSLPKIHNNNFNNQSMIQSQQYSKPEIILKRFDTYHRSSSILSKPLQKKIRYEIDVQ